MKFKHIMFGGLLGFTFASSCLADEMLAVVDVATVVEKSPQMASLKTTLEKQFTPRQQAMSKDQSTLQADMEKLSRDGSTMKEADAKKLREKVASEQAKLQDEQAKMQQEFFQARDKGLKSILDKVDAIVKQISKEKGYAMVLRKEGTVYFKPEADITAQVAAKLK